MRLCCTDTPWLWADEWRPKWGISFPSSRHGGLLPRASHRTVRAGHAYGSLDRSIRSPASAGLIPAATDSRLSHRRRDLSLSCSPLDAAGDSAARMRPVARSSAPRRAVGEREAQLLWSRLPQSISPFAPPAFTGFVANMKRSDFPVGVVRLSLPPSGLPLARTHVDLPE